MARTKRKLPDGFPARLRRARIQKEFSQAELGRLTGIHYNQIGRYEQGSSRPTADNINRLAEALEVSADYLYKGEMEGGARARFSDQDFLRAFQKAEALPEDYKNIIKTIVNLMLHQTRIDEMAASK